MRNLNKWEVQQNAFNYLLDIDFDQDLMSIYKKCTSKPYSSLVNPTCFRKNLLERI